MNQRQDSLCDQLKSLVGVANNIGCYDAADFLQKHIDKVEIKKTKAPINIPLCYKCSNKMLQPDLLNDSIELVGCKELTQTQWEEGNRQGEGGVYYQHNCPMIEEIRKENK